MTPNQPTTPSPQEQEGKVLTAEKIEKWKSRASSVKPERVHAGNDLFRVIYTHEIDEVVALLRAGLAAQEANEGLRRSLAEAEQRCWDNEDRAWKALGKPDGTHETTNVQRLCNAFLAQQAPPTEGALRAAAQRAVTVWPTLRIVVQEGVISTRLRSDFDELIDQMRSALAAKEPAGEAPQKPKECAVNCPPRQVCDYCQQPKGSSDARERGLMGRLREWVIRQHAMHCAPLYGVKEPTADQGAMSAYSKVAAEIDRLLAEAPREDAKAGALVERLRHLHMIGSDRQLDPIAASDLRMLRDAILTVACAVEARR